MDRGAPCIQWFERYLSPLTPSPAHTRSRKLPAKERHRRARRRGGMRLHGRSGGTKHSRPPQSPPTRSDWTRYPTHVRSSETDFRSGLQSAMPRTRHLPSSPRGHPHKTASQHVAPLRRASPATSRTRAAGTLRRARRRPAPPSPRHRPLTGLVKRVPLGDFCRRRRLQRRW